jgi:hypothetical protein
MFTSSISRSSPKFSPSMKLIFRDYDSDFYVRIEKSSKSYAPREENLGTLLFSLLL